MLRHLAFGLIVFGAIGCSKPEPAAERRASTDSNPAELADVPILPKLKENSLGSPDIKFESVEAETAYWQDRAIEEVKKRFAKLTAADIQKIFDELKPHEQANVRRIQTWLPHKRISEMGNAAEDVHTLTSFPTQFEADLALQRLLEFADDSGAPVLIKNLGIKSPRAIVWFRMEYGQILPDTQSLVWGINQKIRSVGIAQLSPSERAIVQTRPGLFPSPP